MHVYDIDRIVGRHIDGFCSVELMCGRRSVGIVRCGPDLVQKRFAEAARVLPPGGHFLIVNFSYRGDPTADRADVERPAQETGFQLLRESTDDFRLWDGVCFLLRKQSA